MHQQVYVGPRLAAAGYLRITVNSRQGDEPTGDTASNQTADQTDQAASDQKTENQVTWRPGYDEDLYDYVVTQGRPFVIVGRNSSDSGSEGYRAAAMDVHGAADVLYALAGMDVRHLMPPVEEIASWLRTRSRVETNVTPDGERFINRFVLFELVGTGVLLSVSTGSGVKVSEEMEQPHPALLKRLAQEIEPTLAGMVAKRSDRYCRSKHGHTPLYDWLEVIHRKRGVWAGDGNIGRWDMDDPLTTVRLQLAATFSSNEATLNQIKHADAKVRRTGNKMVDGRVQCAMRGTVPPGFMLYRDLPTDRMMLALDCPAIEVDPALTRGVPQVFDEGGKRVSQVAIIQHALRRWGVDDLDPVDYFGELADMGLSSQTLRNRHGLAATFLGDQHMAASNSTPIAIAHAFRATLRRNLDVYERGVIKASVNGTVREIENCFPLDGPWASLEDFARIRAFEERNKGKVRRRSRWTTAGWQGMQVVLDGEDAVLRGRDREGRARAERGDGVDWCVDRDGRGARERSPFVPDEALLDSLRRAVRASQGERLAAYGCGIDDRSAAGSGDESGTGDAPRRRAEIERRKTEIAQVRGRLVDRLEEDLTPELMQEIKRRDTALTEEEARLDAEVRDLDLHRAVARYQTGLGSGDVPVLVALLRGEEVPGVRDLLKRGIRELRFTRDASGHHPAVSWSGVLVLEDERSPRGLWSIPFEGRFTAEWVYRYGGASHLVESYRAGVAPRYGRRGMREYTVDLASRLGVPLRQVRASACGDMALTRLWMAVQFPQPVLGEGVEDVTSVDDLACDRNFADQFGGPEAVRALAARMKGLLDGGDKGAWLRNSSRAVTEAVAASALFSIGSVAEPLARTRQLERIVSRRDQAHRWRTNASDATSGTAVTLVPCEFCGGVWCVPMRIVEVTGYLCLESSCRRDEAGVRWPSRFDAQVAHADVLTAAGAPLHLPDAVDGARRTAAPRVGDAAATDSLSDSVREPGRSPEAPLFKWRRGADLTESERADVVNSYACGEHVGSIRERLRVTKSALYELVDAAGVPRRGHKRPIRADEV